MSGSVGGAEVTDGTGEFMMGALAFVTILVAVGAAGTCAASRFDPMKIAMAANAITPTTMNIQMGKRLDCRFLAGGASDL